jgi:PAS domain S-box-containing protein
MEGKPTRQELDDQIAELKRQNEILRLNASFQGEGEKYAPELSILEELSQYGEKGSQSIFNNMGDSVFVKDDQSRLVLVNDAFCELFKLPRAQILGKTLAEHVPSNERDIFKKIDKQVLSDGVENINEETLTIGGGQTRTISTRKSRFVDSTGNKYLVGVIRDITERKEAEEALIKSESKLKELNTTKDKLFSIIAHDLRSPFSNIVGVSELLYLNADNPIQNKKYIDIINVEAKNTLVLLENLLDWSEAQSGDIEVRPEKIQLSEVIKGIIRLKKPLARTKNISLEYAPTQEIEILTDMDILNTVLRNLVSNAIKFTNTGGKVEIMAALNEKQIEITISDNGIGMNDATIQTLFDISTNTTLPGTANERGSGLGLILCKEFVEKLDGSIWAESEVGKGSEFKILLPLKEGENG